MYPNQHGFKMPAEWHPHTGCWMAWPCHLQTWAAIGLESARKAYAEVASAIAEYEPVWMIVHPDDLANAKMHCKNTVRYFPLPINDSWMRDAGPGIRDAGSSVRDPVCGVRGAVCGVRDNDRAWKTTTIWK